MRDLTFALVALLMIAGALGVVLSRNLYRAAYCLGGTLVATAVLYLLLTSPLLAAVQILLYTGGVLTLVVFALVMTESGTDSGGWRRPFPAAAAAVLVVAALVPSLRGFAGGTPGGLEDGKAIGVQVFTTYLVPFELLSLLLLGAIFGALTIARKEGTE